jgi:Na+/melibiose symporter-like transporter
MTDQEHSGEKSVRIKRGKVDSLSLYEITDYELDVLEKGSPGSIYLNFGIFLLSTSLSLLVALLTTEIKSDRVFTVFTVIVVLGVIGGSVLLFLWYSSKETVSVIIKKIKDRIPQEELESSVKDA